MSTVEFLARIQDLGVKVWAEGDRLRYRGSKETLTPALLAELAARKGDLLDVLRAATPQTSIPRATLQGPAPLSFAQQRLWFLDQLLPNSATYNLPVALRLRGRLDVDALAATFGAIVRRHQTLRTTFASRLPGATGPDNERSDQREPVQIIAPPDATRYPLELIDLQSRPAAERAAEAERLVADALWQPFDLERGPLLRTRLIRLAADEHLLLLTLHHIVGDGWSLGVLVQEVAALYPAYARGVEPRLGPVGTPLPIQYADYAVWQRQWMSGALLEREIGYWRHQLADAPALLELPTDRPRPAVQTSHGATEALPLAGVLPGIRALSERAGATLFMTLLSTFYCLLQRYSGQTDLLVGTPIANRARAELEPLIGFFVNTLVLRADLSGDPSFLELLEQIRRVTLQAYEHQDVPFEKLVEVLQPERDLRHTPFFQVMFALQNAPIGELDLPGLTLSPLPSSSSSAKFDLTVQVSESGDDLSAEIEYNTDLFDRATIRRMAAHWQTLIAAVIAQPDQPISALPLLTAAERRRVLHDWNATAADYPAQATIAELFEAQVARTPDAVAVVYGQRQLSYAALNARANALAHTLQRLGVGPDTPVALCVERSIELIVGFVGIVKAGGAYVPLDPSYPSERLRFMLEDTAAPVVVVQPQHVVQLPLEGLPTELVLLDAEQPALDPALANPRSAATATNLAYVIYTSGSTGQPKGVAVSHQAISRLICNTNYVQLGPDDRIAQVSNAAFDAITFEAWGALLSGARLVGISQEVALAPLALIAALRDEAISTLFLTTALFNQLARADARAFSGLRSVLFGGEAVDPRWVREVLRHGPPQQLLHVYGPTETTTFASFYPVATVADDALTVPIGRPLANTTLYVLDRQMQPVPPGVPGELYIGGPGLARGYLRRPALTAERFVPNPFREPRTENREPRARNQERNSGTREQSLRLYKTGDLVRLRDDGAIEYLGRIDQQVKLRGFRIELGEIEAALQEHPAVAEACVVLLRKDAADDNRLVAYVVGAERVPSGQTENQEPGSSPAGAQFLALGAHELRAFLAERLPAYMLPSAFVVLDALPLTASGKIDRLALARRSLDSAPGGRGAEPYVAPRTPAEALLADIWADVLSVAQVGRDDNFFVLGGHSLLATQLISRVRDAFHVDLPLRDLFETLTVARLAERLQAARQQDAPLPPVQPVDRAQPLPLSFGQQRFWFLNQLLPGNAAYVITTGVRLTGRLDRNALERSLRELVRRHEALRTTFALHLAEPLGGGRVVEAPVQIIAPAAEADRIVLPLLDLSATPAEQRQRHLQTLLADEAARPFDLQRGPLLRTTLVCYGPHEHTLVLAVHHIVIDGWSMNLLISELAVLYRALSRPDAAPPALAPLPVQYADYAVWQQQWISGALLQAELDYWKRQLGGRLPVLQLPLDHPRPAVQTVRGANEIITLDATLSDALRALSRRTDATLFMTLLTAFDVLLYRSTGQTDLLVGTPIAGRVRPELEALVGLFLNTLVIRADLRDDPSFSALLQQVRETTLQAFDHQALPFERLVEELQPARDLSHTPVFQVMFNLLNFAEVTLDLPDLQLSLAEPPPPAQFDLTLTMFESPAGLVASFGYNVDLFEPATIARMAAQFEVLLRSIVANPHQSIARLPLLSPAEQQALIRSAHATEHLALPPACLHQLVAAQAQRTPDAIAVSAGQHSLRYRDLDCRANQLARYLRARGVGPDTRVGVCLPRSIDLVVTLLAVLRAGGAYIPLDPNYPAERLQFMVEDAQAVALVTIEALLGPASSRPADSHDAIICLDREQAAIEREAAEPLAERALPDSLAYLIYTSGSTGRPKGVAITHQSAVALLAWAQTCFSADDLRGVLFATSVCFDLSIFELFVPLSSGGRVILVESALELPTLPASAEVTLINTVPSVMAELLRLHDLPASVRVVNLAGEPLSLQLAQQVYAQPHVARLYNLYGPSEDTTYSTCKLVARDSAAAPSIGRPISNTAAYVLDAQLQPVPSGVAGELYLGGAGLARGYLGRPALTAERFVPDPFSDQPGARLYRTGDLVRARADGELEFLGRIDGQIKLRGFRIETGEIESVLGQHPQVRAAVVLLRDERLVAYVVGEQRTGALGANQEPGSGTDGSQVLALGSELRAFLAERLPEYMLPSAFVVLDALPLTPNGKLDRAALPAPEPARPELRTAYVAPQTPIEAELAAIWAEVLQIERVGIHDHFFELGGHSMLALQVVSRLRQTMQVELPVRTLFTTPTIATLAQHISVIHWAATSRAASSTATSGEEGEL